MFRQGGDRDGGRVVIVQLWQNYQSTKNSAASSIKEYNIGVFGLSQSKEQDMVQTFLNAKIVNTHVEITELSKAAGNPYGIHRSKMMEHVASILDFVDEAGFKTPVGTTTNSFNNSATGFGIATQSWTFK